jgi:hypothetical protein
MTNGRSNGIITALIYTQVSKDEMAREGVSLDAQPAECQWLHPRLAGHRAALASAALRCAAHSTRCARETAL